MARRSSSPRIANPIPRSRSIPTIRRRHSSSPNARRTGRRSPDPPSRPPSTRWWPPPVTSSGRMTRRPGDPGHVRPPGRLADHADPRRADARRAGAARTAPIATACRPPTTTTTCGTRASAPAPAPTRRFPTRRRHRPLLQFADRAAERRRRDATAATTSLRRATRTTATSTSSDPATNTLVRTGSMHPARGGTRRRRCCPTARCWCRAVGGRVHRPGLRTSPRCVPPTARSVCSTGATHSNLSSGYPKNFVGPDGKVFGIANEAMYRIDPAGNGLDHLARHVPHRQPRRHVDLGDVRARQDPAGRWRQRRTQPAAHASVIDINGGSPVVTSVCPTPSSVGTGATPR